MYVRHFLNELFFFVKMISLLTIPLFVALKVKKNLIVTTTIKKISFSIRVEESSSLFFK